MAMIAYLIGDCAAVQGVGIDAPQPTDLYYRLLVDEVFYVGGMGGTAAAETLSREVRGVNSCVCCISSASCVRYAQCFALPAAKGVSSPAFRLCVRASAVPPHMQLLFDDALVGNLA